MQRGAAHYHRTGAAVIADGDFQPVRQQRVVRVAEHAADIGGVFLRRIEVGVAGDVDRQVQRRGGHRHQRLVAQRGVVAQRCVFAGQQRGQALAGLGPGRLAQRDEAVQGRAGEGALCCGGQQAGVIERGQVGDLVADGNADARRLAFDGEHAVGQVLQREVGLAVVGAVDPAGLGGGHWFTPGFVGFSGRSG
ncbi:hypothetical protein D3C81_1645350 [compost metagenome]